MKRRLLVFLVVGLIAAALIGLNAATYTQKEKTPDNEFAPNRSSYNSGSTGSQAFYALLAETGRTVVRWQRPTADLAAAKRNRPDVFVLIGKPRKELTEMEMADLLKWAADGGRLVLIDRDPPEKLLILDPWSLSSKTADDPGVLALDPTDVKQMTAGAPAAKPVQPTALTASVNAVQTSRLASDIRFTRKNDADGSGSGNEDDGADGGLPPFGEEDGEDPSPVDGESNKISSETRKLAFQNAAGSGNGPSLPPAAKPAKPAAAVGGPVIHFASGIKNVVVDVAYGSGEIVLVSDPYIVSNAGIGLVDNAQLAINLVSGRSGPIAFDEYHQGYGSNNNRLLQYFEGTPVIAIFIQLALLVGLILFSQSRRFARPLPADEPDRLSKLEYIAAMAELQQRTRAYDLAIENVYREFRRRAARLVGADNAAVKRDELARLVAERAEMPPREIDELMFKCEDIIHGEPTNRRETLDLIKKLRAVEEKLGLSRSARSMV